jgi:hypothetical protein
MAKKKKQVEETEDTGVKDIDAALAALDDEDWADTEEQGFSEVPDGNYIVKINKAVINNAKSSGRLQVSWEMTVVCEADGSDSEFKGRKIFKHDGINNSDARGWFKSGLARLGVMWPKKAAKLPKTLEELIDTHAEIKVKTKEESDFVAKNFVRAVDESEIPDADDSDDDEDEDEDDDKKKSSSKKKTKKPADDDDDTEDDDSDDSDDDDDDDKEDEDSDDDDDDDDEDEPEEKPKKKTGKGKAKDEPTCEVEFEDDAIDKKMKKELIKVAEENDFDPDDYKTTAELMGDVAEYLGISGTYKVAKKLMAKIAEQAAK